MPQEKFSWEELFKGGKWPFATTSRGRRRGTAGMDKGLWSRTSKRTKIIVGIILLVLLVIILSASWLSTFYTDYLWFREVGFTSIFWKVFWTKIWVFFLFGTLFFVILYGNLYLAQRFIPKYEVLEDQANTIEATLANFRQKAGKWLGRGLLALSLLISFFVGWGSAGQWEKVLKYFTHARFGSTDPIFGKDIGFYMFKFPMHQYMADWLFSVLITVLFLTAAAHFLYGAINFSRERQRFSAHTKAHLSVIAGAILLVQAWRFRLDMYKTLFSGKGVTVGAGYAEVHALIPALWILLAISIICAILFIINIRYRGWKLPAIGLVTIIVVSLVAGSLVPFIVQNYVVKPKELDRQSKYIGYNIEMTQDAYNIQDEGENARVEKRDFPVEENLTYQDIQNNQTTVSNIRLWDPTILIQVLNQRQELRQEYNFGDVDVDRYHQGDGSYTQMLTSARELLYEQLRQDAKSWQNQHLSYTHGYGVCMAPSNQETSDGDPILVIKDIPPVSQEGLGIEVTRPELYFGEQAHDYVVVRTPAPEIDYPMGNTNKLVEPYYEGKGGIQMNSFLKRLAFSIRFKDITLFFSGYIKPESRLMFRRNIRERVLAVAPFLRLDNDPYVVVDDSGKIYWIVDAYTTSDRYPYSQFHGDINYIRNSVKVVIDAYDGSMRFYLVDPGDAIAQTYAKIFPGLFTPMEEMPEDIRKHLRYPEDLFTIQMEMYKTYHINEIDAFYHKEDLWEIPTQIYGVDKGTQEIHPYYVILKLPEEKREEMILMIPFNPHGKGNMVNWVAARCDFPGYGKLINYVFPTNKQVTGTQQFEALVDQETQISEQITLWNQAGSRVIRGNTLVIPIEKSLIYVEPLYLLAQNPAIPQLKRVIVSDGKNVFMGETLQSALEGLFGFKPQPTPQPQSQPQLQPEATMADLVQQANQLYQEAQNALKAGDWATYGDRIKRVGEILAELSKRTQQ